MRILSTISKFLRRSPSRGFERLSYSQYAEDLIARELLKGVNNGTYVDVGAFHPFMYSNTYRFYLEGWSGIVIEPNPEQAEAFQRHRPRDKFINCGVGEERQELEYSYYSEGVFNGFHSSEQREQISSTKSTFEKSEAIPVKPLKDLLDLNAEIKLLSVDAEGHDLSVLKSFDWSAAEHPKVVITEVESRSILALSTNQTHLFLVDLGYELASFCIKSGIYVKQ